MTIVQGVSRNPNSKGTSVPILVIGFNRPDKIKTLLTRLELLGAENVFISLDGPRSPSEAISCEASLSEALAFRDIFNLSIVWRDYNLGCCLGVVAALDWFFSLNEHGIIIEDDCVPEISMLEFLEDGIPLIKDPTTDIGMITAHNPFRFSEKVQISNYHLIQGWATTAVVWHKARVAFFDLQMPQFLKRTRRERSLAESIFWWANSTRARLGKVDTWDGMFSDRMWRLGYKTVVPKINLIQNSGFDERATHTTDANGSIFVDFPKNESVGFDKALKVAYFRIRTRNLFTAPLKVLMNFVFSGKRNFEEILESDLGRRKQVLRF